MDRWGSWGEVWRYGGRGCLGTMNLRKGARVGMSHIVMSRLVRQRLDSSGEVRRSGSVEGLENRGARRG